jgi:hypothetical protein
MKATIEIPDELYRQIKARSALGGKSMREVTIGLYRAWLLEGEPAQPGQNEAMSSEAVAEAWLATWEELGNQVKEAASDSGTTRDSLTAQRARW